MDRPNSTPPVSAVVVDEDVYHQRWTSILQRQSMTSATLATRSGVNASAVRFIVGPHTLPWRLPLPEAHRICDAVGVCVATLWPVRPRAGEPPDCIAEVEVLEKLELEFRHARNVDAVRGVGRALVEVYLAQSRRFDGPACEKWRESAIQKLRELAEGCAPSEAGQAAKYLERVQHLLPDRE